MTRTILLSAALAALVSSGCGPGRTAAATQPTPAAFDPAASDAKALEVVDAMMTALGGEETWNGVKQIRWETRYSMDGEVGAMVNHAWDIWNGRHRCELADMSTAQQEEGPVFSVVMYELFEHEGPSGHGTYDGKPVDSAQREKMKKTCYTLWQQHAYQLTMPFKLKDPGVKLEHVGQMKEMSAKTGDTVCQPACDSIKVTFDPQVGTETWWVHINTDSKRPELIEKQIDAGRLAYVLSDWTEAGGLWFARKHQNAGLPGEVFQYQKISIGEPDDALFIPQVR